ncbi:MAG: glycosyltransferase [gamma proteobacterium symbiont of Lucinoma myriamae]|nr:glycosyltransferase [gamma proteobacterium symbiont of Lucinoma myriamae]
MKNDLISIIIPFYNHAQYLEETVQSLLDQSYQNI